MGIDLFKVVAFLFRTEASLLAARPFPGDSLGRLFALAFMFACPAFSPEICPDDIPGGEATVLVGRIYGVGPGQSDLSPGKALYFEGCDPYYAPTKY